MSGVPAALVVGPEHHGVVRHGELIAAAAGLAVHRHERVPDRLPAAPAILISFTDGVFGDRTEDAAESFARLTEGTDVPIVTVLHDLPDDDSSDRSARRRATYRVVAERSAHLVVASEHERTLLSGLAGDVPITVVPLPIVDEPVTLAHDARRSLGILGFVYPGKGHEAVLEAARDLPADVWVIAGGAPSAGHDDLVEELMAAARRLGRPFAVTGPLDEPALEHFLAATEVPVVPARATSASLSLATWIGAGRRPLAVANPYTNEMVDRLPGLLDVVRPAQLGEAMRERLADPELTWRTAPVPSDVLLATVAATVRRLVDEHVR